MADSLFDEDTSALLVNQFYCKRVECDGADSFVAISLDSLELDIANPVVAKSKVFRGVWKGEKVAVKLVPSLNQREMEVLNGIHHKNIVRFLGVVYEPPTSFGFVTQLCEKGSLFDYIHSGNNPPEFVVALQLAKGIASGVRYLHRDAPDAPIKHNNLTSHEVVLREEKGVLVPKISGFGYARQHSQTQMSASCGEVHVDTLMSPERMEGEGSSPESDMYSVGLILYELVSGKVPFEGFSLLEAVTQITDEGKRPEIPSSCPSKMAATITWCWKQNPEDRLTAGEVDALLERMNKKLSVKKATDVLVQSHVTDGQPSPYRSMHSACSRHEWQIEEYEIADISEPFNATGKIGIMRKATYQHRPVVLKGVKHHLLEGFDRYVEVLFPLQHENIVKVLGATNNHIVMEEMPKSLDSCLRDGPITKKSTLLKIAIDVASGLHYLHKLTNAIIHGGIHPQNVFLDLENNAKVSDAGYVILDRITGLTPKEGLEDYHAPEASNITRYGVGVDIYSFGILLTKMYTLKTDCCSQLKDSWPELHALVAKCSQKRQEGMYYRGKIGMRYLIRELKKMF